MNDTQETAEPRPSVCTDLLARWILPSTFERVLTEFETEDIECPLEILHIVAALRELCNSTQEHAINLQADGFTLKAEEAQNRSDQYDRTIDAIKEVWS